MSCKIFFNNNFPFFKKIWISAGTKIFPWFIDINEENVYENLKIKFQKCKRHFETLLYYGFIEKRIYKENGWEIPEYYVTMNFECSYNDEIKEILGICGYTKFQKPKN